ncbi:hypothetical protein Emed_003910 [Eimeria media]
MASDEEEFPMDEAQRRSPSIASLAQSGTELPPPCNSVEAGALGKAVEGSIFIPLNVEELSSGCRAQAVTPIEAYLTYQGPLVTPDACPLLSFEDDRRVRFRDCDEEWLLTEEISVASASARCSEEASLADAKVAKPGILSPVVASEVAYSAISDQPTRYSKRMDAVTGHDDSVDCSHPKSCNSPKHLEPADSSFSCTMNEVSGDQSHDASSAPPPLHFWWTARGDCDGAQSQQNCFLAVTANSSDMATKRDRRHTAPGALKTALIRSADGTLRRRPLHSPPCLTTSHPPKSCVRIQSEGVVGGFQSFGNRTSIGSLLSPSQSTSRHEGYSAYVPQVTRTSAMPPRRHRTLPGPRFSSLIHLSPLGRRVRSCESHISHHGALVDIAALELD